MCSVVITDNWNATYVAVCMKVSKDIAIGKHSISTYLLYYMSTTTISTYTRSSGHVEPLRIYDDYLESPLNIIQEKLRTIIKNIENLPSSKVTSFVLFFCVKMMFRTIF